MPRKSEKKRLEEWQKRAETAEKARNKWAERYRVDLCERFYEGHQWEDEDEEQSKYTINLIFPTVEIKIPALFFSKPVVNVTPRPGRSDDPGSLSYERAKLIKDTLNTLIQEPRLKFQREGQRGLKEAFWAYCVLEVGYTADYIDRVLSRITLGGAIYVSAVCILPTLLIQRFNVPFYFGGTALLIVVGVALDTVAQIETHLLTRNYEGFMRRGRIKSRRG